MKFEYTSEQQLIEDAAKEMIRRHLAASGSCETVPSKNAFARVSGEVAGAILGHEFTLDEWNELSNETMEFWLCYCGDVYRMAAEKADATWEATIKALGL